MLLEPATRFCGTMDEAEARLDSAFCWTLARNCVHCDIWSSLERCLVLLKKALWNVRKVPLTDRSFEAMISDFLVQLVVTVRCYHRLALCHRNAVAVSVLLRVEG